MKNLLKLLVTILLSIITNESFAQNANEKALIPDQKDMMKSSTYIMPYTGVLFQGSFDVEQTGVAHKRGDFNAYNTDFDLLVDVKGKSKNNIGAVLGLTYGTVWQKKNSKLKPGLEFDLFYTKRIHESKLANSNTEEVANVHGDSLDYVLELVEEHYSAGHHKFSNKMEMTSFNAAVKFTLGYSITNKVSITSALGIGFCGITMTNAASKQSSPASANSDYEISKVTGAPVNHFNSNTKSSSNLMFAQFRIGTNISLSHNITLCIDAQGLYRDKSEFTFGSTVYSDHPPTDSWKYSIDKGLGIMLTTGLRINLQ